MTKGGIALLAAGWLGILPLSSAFATDVTYGSWLDTVKWGGDLRLRHDSIFSTSNTSNRDRDRFRLRYGLEAASGDITAIFRLATSAGTATNNPTGAAIGTPPSLTNVGDPLSANQTEDSAFSRKSFWVDLAYLKYKPLDILTVKGGKMDNPFWSGWSSSLVWDPDLNPEGYAQEVNLPVGPVGLFATLGQFSINEASGFHDANPWMFAERLGANVGIMDDMKATLSATDYGFTHEKLFPFNGDNKQGNTRATVTTNGTAYANVLTSSFNILQLDGKLKLRAGDLPITLEGGFVRNTEESVNKGRDGDIFGLTLGNASKAHTWEVAYYYKRLGANAVIADFVDDDFGYAGTNQGGHIFWVGYAPRENVLLKAMFYDTHILDTTLTTAAPFTNHLMLDVVVKI
jgi:hypothetical protein